MSSMYQSSSFSNPGVTSPFQQVPKSPDFSELAKSDELNKVTLPAGNTIQERPTSVIVNKTGIYKFLYHTTASIGGLSTGETYVSGSEVVNAGPIELPIQPVAWSNCGAAETKGEVTFVYKGVK